MAYGSRGRAPPRAPVDRASDLAGSKSAHACGKPHPVGHANASQQPDAGPNVRASRIHVVVKGETLTGIAATYGVTVAAIEKANSISNTGLIYVGEHLVIPAR